MKFKNRKDFYNFLKKNHNKIKELYIEVKYGNPDLVKDGLSYIDAVEVALCFGWIDSTKSVINKKVMQRFSKRNKNSPFSELNKERCRRLIKLKDMDKSGLEVIPNLDEYKPPKYLINKIIKNKKAYEFFIHTPKLYQNIRLYNLDFYHKLDLKIFNKSFKNFIKNCENHKLYGQYDDYGRLSNY